MAATPHVEEFETVAQRISEKDRRRQDILSAVNAETRSRRLPDGNVENITLEGPARAAVLNLESLTKELNHARRDALRRLKTATVEISFAGAEKPKISLFFVAVLLQAFSLASLVYLWLIRRKTLANLFAAERCSRLSGASSADYAGLALPTSVLLYPLPKSGAQAFGIRAFLDERSSSTRRGLPLYLILVLFVALNTWLLQLNFRIFNLLVPKLGWDSLQFLLGCSLGAAVVVVCVSWLFLGASPATNEDAIALDRRLFISLPLAGMLAGVMGAESRESFLRLVSRSLRQLPFRLFWRRPRFKVKSREKLKTNAVEDGFLYNKRRDRWHVVREGRVLGVRNTESARSAFSRFAPFGVNFSSDSNPAPLICESLNCNLSDLQLTGVPHIANGKTVLALERAVSGLASHSAPLALDVMFRLIELQLEGSRERVSIRMLDVYAKLAVRNYEDKRFDQFLEMLRSSGIAGRITDRMQKWSAKDTKDNKWRIRVRKCARSSNGGYPVAGRCEFESRPNTPHRKRTGKLFGRSRPRAVRARVHPVK